MTTITPKKGDLLIAEPSIIGDVSFNRSIVLIADHSDEGSIGFILNKPLDYAINELVPEIDANFKVYNGGPVEQDNLYFIHKIPELIPDSIEISLGIYWGGDFKKVVKLIEEGNIKENDLKFFLGYSGWDATQLENELKANSWVVAENVYKQNIIEKDYKSFWKEKMLEFGGEYSIWSNAPENPNYN
ncbi:YqgE/AlgH family protein [Seonamhaeicola aphaedonensis]|nr:YqgE/AlgH family protein [Seonamhaeicola aphaedonensis]